jgi:hypothetical protein
LSDGALAYQVQGLEFKSQYHQKKKKEQKENLIKMVTIKSLTTIRSSAKCSEVDVLQH